MKMINFGRNKTSAMIAMLALLLVALGCGAEKPSAPPTESEAQAMVKSSMTDFADAVDKGDFSTFRTNSSKEMQVTSADQMKTTFKSFADQKEAVVPILREASKMNATFDTPPAVREESGYSILVTNGRFDTQPAAKFKNEYVYQDGKWKLLKFDLNM